MRNYSLVEGDDVVKTELPNAQFGTVVFKSSRVVTVSWYGWGYGPPETDHYCAHNDLLRITYKQKPKFNLLHWLVDTLEFYYYYLTKSY